MTKKKRTPYGVSTENKCKTSDRVAPPTMNTKTRWPIFFKSLDACLSTESLQGKQRDNNLTVGALGMDASEKSYFAMQIQGKYGMPTTEAEGSEWKCLWSQRKCTPDSSDGWACSTLVSSGLKLPHEKLKVMKRLYHLKYHIQYELTALSPP